MDPLTDLAALVMILDENGAETTICLVPGKYLRSSLKFLYDYFNLWFS